jgi:hypothetical protein
MQVSAQPTTNRRKTAPVVVATQDVRKSARHPVHSLTKFRQEQVRRVTQAGCARCADVHGYSSPTKSGGLARAQVTLVPTSAAALRANV